MNSFRKFIFVENIVMKIHSKIILLLAATFFFACSSPTPKENENQTNDSLEKDVSSQIPEKIDTTIVSGDYKLQSISVKQELKGLKLELVTPKAKELKEGIQKLHFKVTDDDNAAQLNELEVGLLINNELVGIKPAEDAVFNVQLLDGNNVVFAYVKEKAGESIKQPKSYILENFFVGKGQSNFDVQQPQLFYLPTSATENGENTNNLLDFYAVNVSLASNSYQLKLTIDTNVIYLNHWAAYKIQGLEKGTHHFRLQLLDADKRIVSGPFNDSGIREVLIK